MKIYISGKIGDLHIDVYTAKFADAESMLNDAGHDTINPVKIHDDPACLIQSPQIWEEFMINDIAALFQCDGIYMLPCWQDSPGARVEHAIAREMGKKIYYAETAI